MMEKSCAQIARCNSYSYVGCYDKQIYLARTELVLPCNDFRQVSFSKQQMSSMCKYLFNVHTKARVWVILVNYCFILHLLEQSVVFQWNLL